jgi:SAM-dependent methyltransferase
MTDSVYPLRVIFRVDNPVEAYRLKAKFARDTHELAGRKDRVDLTHAVLDRVLVILEPKTGDILVDIGCGDGYLLRKAAVRHALGITATDEERDRLLAEGLDVRQGLTHELPVIDGVADVTVCNGVLFLVSPELVPRSLEEIARITRPGGAVWIGEMPTRQENADVPRHSSVAGLLWFLLTKRGPRSFLGMCRRLVRSLITGEPFILNSGPAMVFVTEPAPFVEMAREAGLEIKQVFDTPASMRLDYLFVRS